MSDYTAMQQAAADRLDEINERMAEIDDEIDREACWDPTVETSDAEMALAEEYDELLTERMNCKRILPEHEVSL